MLHVTFFCEGGKILQGSEGLLDKKVGSILKDSNELVLLMDWYWRIPIKPPELIQKDSKQFYRCMEDPNGFWGVYRIHSWGS